MRLIGKYKWMVIGGIVGLMAGYAYWYFIGCSSGTCPITSNPINSSIYGTILGMMVANMFEETKNHKSKTDNQIKP